MHYYSNIVIFTFCDVHIHINATGILAPLFWHWPLVKPSGEISYKALSNSQLDLVYILGYFMHTDNKKLLKFASPIYLWSVIVN